MTAPIKIKGIREGLLVTLGDGEWSEIRAALLYLIEQQAEFLKGGRVALDIGNYVLNASELGKLRDDFSQRNLSLWAVLTNSPKTELTAQSLGLATRISKPLPQEYPPKSPDSRLFDGENAVYIKRTLRSGFSVQHPGHIIVIGDVNPGAEIIAGGSIIVWGKLKGVVHAGANGDQNAIVCALDLSPTQLRIAEHIALAPQRRGKPMPEVARLVDGHVIADAWNSTGK